MSEDTTPQSLDDMSLEQLDAVLDGEAPNPVEVTEEATQETQETSEAPPQEAVEASAEEASTEETETVPSEQPDAEAETQEEAPTDLAAEVEILKAELAAREAADKHWEQVAGRHGNEIGLLRKQLQERGAQPVPQSVDELGVDELGEQPMQPAPPQRQPGPDPTIGAWAVQQALRNALAGVKQEYPDYDHGDLDTYAQSRGIDVSRLLESNDPAWVEQEAAGLFKAHYFQTQQAQAAARVEELKAKRVEQSATIAAAKNAAMTSAPASRAAPAPQPKSNEEKTLEELDEELERLHGGQW